MSTPRLPKDAFVISHFVHKFVPSSSQLLDGNPLLLSCYEKMMVWAINCEILGTS